MEQLKNKKSHAEPASTPLEINNIQDFLRWVFIESSAKWLFMILLFEYIVAVNLSPTILTDYPLFNWVVEKLSFIPAVHNFDDIAVHPEAVRFYIALAFLLLIPKAISIYYFLVKNPITEMRQYVITPYTTTKPKSTRQILAPRMTQEQAKQLPTVERSMRSRVFWSIMTLLFTVGSVIVMIITNNEILPSYAKGRIENGGISMWFEISLQTMMLSAVLLAVSIFIIKDYIKYFKEKLSKKTI